MKIKDWTILSFAVSFAALFCACSNSEKHDDAEHAEHEENVVVLSHEQAEAAGVKVAAITVGDFQESIRVSGQVMGAQGDEAVIVAKSTGVLNFIKDHISEGMPVRNGEIIAGISGETVVGGDPVAAAIADREAKAAALERAKRLIADTIISKKEYERIEAEYIQAKIAAGSTKNSSQKGGSVVASPLTGFVKNVIACEGEYVQVGQVIATVTRSCNLQLRAEVPEKYFSMMNSFVDANFVMSYDAKTVYKVSELNGHLASLGTTLSEGTSSIPVTFEFENKGNVIPGSFADIWLLGRIRSGVLAVPTEALTEEQGAYFVYVQLDHPNEFEKREVKLGMHNGTHTEIISGLKNGENVVVNGVYQVKLASASGSIPEAHSHEH